MASEANDFQRGDDFISFGGGEASTSGAQNVAGPSRLPPTSSNKAKPQLNPNKKAGVKKGKDKAKVQAGKDPKLQEKKKGKKGNLGKKEREAERKAQETGVPRVGKKRARADESGPKNLKEERRAAERHAPWTDLVDWDSCNDPAEMLNAEIDAFYRHVSPTKEEYEVRLFMIELITRAIMRTWPDAEVTPFGSWQTQLYLPHGDIDLVVSVKNLTEANKGRMLAELARAMRMAHLTDVVAIIAKARVPIIKFVTTEGKINVDISLNQTNGISAGQIINQYLDVLPGCRQLILVVKAFLSQRSMNEVYTGGLGSYAVICLVISFLQLHPKLRRADIDPEQNLGTLLVEFFELYGRNFSYDEVGISIRRGGSYFTKRSRNWYKGQQPYLLCIEDPQDRDNDISSGSFGIRQVKSTLSGACEMLQARLFERAEQISGRRAGRYEGDWDPEEMSILTGVMGITKETQKHRRELQRLHQEGRLQRMLSIPPQASPEGYVQNYRPPPIIGVKRKAGTIRIAGAPGASGIAGGPDGDAPPARKKRKSADGLGAVMMDDDAEDGELGENIFDEDDEDEDEDESDEEDDEADDEDDEEDDEEGEIEEDEEEDNEGMTGVVGIEHPEVDDEEDEVEGALLRDESDISTGIVAIESAEEHDVDDIPPANILAGPSSGAKIRNRAESIVSHDSDDFEIQPPRPRAGAENVTEESRYAVGKGKPNGAKRGKAFNPDSISVGDSDSGVESDGSSGSSIIALSGPPPAAAKKEKAVPPPSTSAAAGSAKDSEVRADGGAKASGVNGPGSVGRKAKRDFWAAKAGRRDEGEKGDGEEDDFGGGADFVRL